MNLKKVIFIITVSLLFTSCGKEDVKLQSIDSNTTSSVTTTQKPSDESYTEEKNTTSTTIDIGFEYEDNKEKYPMPELMVFDDLYSDFTAEDKSKLEELAVEYFTAMYDTTNGYNPIADNHTTVEDFKESMGTATAKVHSVNCLNLIFDNDLAGGMFVCVDLDFKSDEIDDRLYIFLDMEFYRTSVDSEWTIDYSANPSMYYYDEIYVHRDTETQEIVVSPRE